MQISTYIDNNLTMIDAHEIKSNRLALLQNIVGIVKTIADLSLSVDQN